MLMQYVGGKLIMQLDKISDLKLLHQNTITEYNKITYAITTDGIIALAGSNVQNISDGIVTNWLKDNVTTDDLDDASTGIINGTIAWSLPINDELQTLAFNSGKYSVLTNITKVSAGKTNARTLDSFTGSIDNIDSSFDTFVKGAATTLISYKNKLCFIGNEPDDCELSTGTLQFDNITRVNRLVPTIDLEKDTEIIMTLCSSREGLNFTDNTRNYNIRKQNAPCRGRGRYFSVKMVIKNSKFRSIDAITLRG